MCIFQLQCDRISTYDCISVPIPARGTTVYGSAAFIGAKHRRSFDRFIVFNVGNAVLLVEKHGWHVGRYPGLALITCDLAMSFIVASLRTSKSSFYIRLASEVLSGLVSDALIQSTEPQARANRCASIPRYILDARNGQGKNENKLKSCTLISCMTLYIWFIQTCVLECTSSRLITTSICIMTVR